MATVEEIEKIQELVGSSASLRGNPHCSRLGSKGPGGVGGGRREHRGAACRQFVLEVWNHFEERKGAAASMCARRIRSLGPGTLGGVLTLPR